MIVDGFLNLFYSILAPLFDLLPDGTFPIDENDGQALNQFLYRIDYLLPVVTPLAWLGTTVAASALAFLAYRLGLLLFNKVRGA